MRAIAVLLVVIYHVWPTFIPGGYVGVDVFFVISGFLITGLLMREFERDGRISMLRFYGRRIRRLLPAATVTLIGVVAASFFLTPETYWRGTAKEVVASALYVQNWWLAFQAVDYLNADSAASPVQHFWSLSVEEQFYLFWPWLLVGGAVAASWLGRGRLMLLSWLFGMVGVGSLVYSVWLTHAEPAFAFFATTTRVWELAMGAGLAVLAMKWAPEQRLSRSLRLTGVGMILVSAFCFTVGTAFPGYAALLPTVGASLVIIAGQDSRDFGLYGLLRSRLFQFFGGVSYSLYLWHWPLVVFYDHKTGQSPGMLAGGLLVALAVLLAYGSKRLVEDRFRSSPGPAPEHLWKPYGLGAACIVLCGIVAAGQFLTVGRVSAPETKAAASEPSSPGAAVMRADFNHHFTPSLADAAKDRPDVDKKCHGSLKGEAPDLTCVFGPADARFDLAIVGDSHSWHWVPALLKLVEPLDMRIQILTKSACPFTTATMARRSGDYVECAVWNQRVLEHLIATQPDLVFTSASSGIAARRGAKESSAEVIAEGFEDMWEVLIGAGIGVVALRDTPRFRGEDRDPIACLSKKGNRPADCVVARSEAVQEESGDPNALAAKDNSEVHYVDLTDQICNAVACEPVVGGVLLWADRHHMTATFAATLAPALREPLEIALTESGLLVVDSSRPTTRHSSSALHATGTRQPTPSEPVRRRSE